jgi:myosin heavy subunit
MGDLTERTPLVIAAEINMINYQTGRILLTNAVEIGRRLKEAKDLLPHGEWGKWLEESVSFAQSTATRLMQLCEEYGPKLQVSIDEDGSSNCASMHNLTYTQAVILLGLPAEEREEFISDNDVGSMSTRELRQAIADRDQALGEKNQALQENEGLKKDLNNKNSAIAGLTTQIETLAQQAKDYKQKCRADQDKASSKPRAPEEATKEIPPAAKTVKSESNPKTTETNAAALKYEAECTLQRENMTNAFNALLTALTALARTEPEVKEKCRLAASRLAESMVNTLKEWPPAVRMRMLVNTSASGEDDQ